MTAAGIADTFLLAPVSQDPLYNLFADGRRMFGLARFWNVFTNVPFALIGLFGLALLPRLPAAAPQTAYIMLCLGAILSCFGSGYYHLSPFTQTLVWDRVPMMIILMSLCAMVIQDRVSARAGRLLLLPLIALGIGAVEWWNWTEGRGQGDLRPYLMGQYLPLLLMALMLMLWRGKSLSSVWLWIALLTHGLARAAEHYDQIVYNKLRVMSGHSLYHLLAALAVLWVVLAAVRGVPRNVDAAKPATV